MEKDLTRESTNRTGQVSRNTLLLAVAGGLAAAAWWSMARESRHERRYADHAAERRNPLHFFLAGSYPRRRQIDRSGQRPLFERRQSVYDAY